MRPELTCSGRFFVPANMRRVINLPNSGRDRNRNLLDAKNRIYGRHNLVHGSVNVERETNQIHRSNRGIVGNQGLPRRVSNQIDSHHFLIAITEIAHPA